MDVRPGRRGANNFGKRTPRKPAHGSINIRNASRNSVGITPSSPLIDQERGELALEIGFHVRLFFANRFSPTIDLGVNFVRHMTLAPPVVSYSPLPDPKRSEGKIERHILAAQCSGAAGYPSSGSERTPDPSDPDHLRRVEDDPRSPQSAAARQTNRRGVRKAAELG